MKKAYTIFLCLILCGLIHAEYPQIVHQSLARIIYTSPAGESWGSGVVIDQEYVLSCYHVIKDKPAGKFNIIISTGKKSRNLNATVIKEDPEKDLVLLKLSEPIPWKTARVAKKIKWGEKIYFGGYSSFPFPRIRIDFLTIRKKEGIYLDALYFGDSGGGVFNVKQELIGIIYNTYSFKNSLGDRIPTLRGYAIPLETIKEFLKDAIST